MKFLLHSIFLFTLLSFVPHEYYVSTFQLEYNAEEKQIEAELKVFSDDLELLLKTRNGSALDLNKGEHRGRIKELLKIELERKVVYTNGKGKIKPLTFIGIEVKGDDTFVFFAIKDVKWVKNPELQINWMTELFPEQVNIVHFNNGNEKLTQYYNSQKTKLHFVF